MRRFRVIAMVVVLAAAGLAAAAWQGPRALDWSHLEPRLQEALGREVSLDGPIRFDLLPRPELTIGGVSAIDIKVREVRAVLDAGSLLAGSLEIETLELSGLELTLDRSLIRPLPPLPARHIRIRDSTVAAGGAIVPVETATLAVRGPQGPYRLEAQADLGGRQYRIAASIGVWQDRIPVVVSMGNGGFEAVATGTVGRDPAAGFVFSGRLTAEGKAAPGWHGAFEADVRIGPDGAELTAVDAVVDDQRLSGAVRADWRGRAAIDARLSTGLLDLDRWRDRLLQLAGAAPGAGLRLALDAGAVKFGERTARKVEAAFRRHGGRFAVESFAAALPGGTRVQMTGHGHDRAAASVRTKNLRVLLLWLGLDPSAVDDARLRDLEAQGRLRLAGEGITPDALRKRLEGADFALEELHARIDGARIDGRLGRRQGRFEAELTIDGLPLDPYRPALEGLGLPAGSLRLDLARTRLFGVSARRLEVAADIGEGGDITVSRLAVEDAGGLSGEGSGKFGADAASFRVSGRMTDPDRSAGLYGLSLPVIARGLGAIEFEGRAEGPSGRLPMDIRASAGGRSLRLSGTLSGQAHFQGRVELEGPPPPALLPWPDGEPAALTASVSARRDHAEFSDIDLRLGPVRVQGAGSVSLNGDRPAAAFALAAAHIDLPASSLDFPVWRRRPLDTAQFGAFDLGLDLEVGSFGIGSEKLDDLRLNLSLAPEAWTLRAGRAGWRGGRLAFDGYLTDRGRALLKMRVRDTVLPERMDFGPSGARTDGFLALEAEGRSPHGLVSALSGTASLEFSGGRLAGIDPAAARSALEDAPTSADVLRRLRNALVSGRNPLVSGRLEARIRDGVARPVAGSFALAEGQVAISGFADLRRRVVDLAGRLAFPDRPETPPLGFSIAGPLSDPDRRPEVGSVEAVLLSRGVAGLVRSSAN